MFLSKTRAYLVEIFKIFERERDRRRKKFLEIFDPGVESGVRFLEFGARYEESVDT